MFPKEKMIQYYEDRLAVHGDHYLSLDWKSDESQSLRYAVFEELFKLGRKERAFSLLDVGCGFGDMHSHLKARGYDFDYLGLDISPQLIEQAKRKHPLARFEIKDLLKETPQRTFDYVFASGVFNIRLDDESRHIEYVRSMIIKMYELCRIGAGINFLSANAYNHVTDEDFNKNQYYYFRPEDIIHFIRYVASRFILRHDYHPGDFTAFLLKK